MTDICIEKNRLKNSVDSEQFGNNYLSFGSCDTENVSPHKFFF